MTRLLLESPVGVRKVIHPRHGRMNPPGARATSPLESAAARGHAGCALCVAPVTMPHPRDPPMPSSPDPSNPIREILDDAESELSRRLREACEVEARGVSTESAAEIRKLEDTLLAAALAAERALTARKHLAAEGAAPSDTRPETRDPSPGPSSDAPSSDPGCDPASSAVREFDDETGRTWRAWPVTPGLGRAGDRTRRGLGEFRDGWICFEALDNSGRRRLPRHEPRWLELPPDELNRLLAQAFDAPGRKLRDPGPREAGRQGVH